MSAKGKAFKAKAKFHLLSTQMGELMGLSPQEPYVVLFEFYFKESITCTTFGKKGGAKTRYKKIDVSNRVKLVEDVLKDVTGVDDSNTMTLLCTKKEDLEREHTEIYLWRLEEAEFLNGITVQGM